MDPMQQIWDEAARRGMAGVGAPVPSSRGMAGVGAPAPSSPGVQERVLGGLLNAVPRVGTFVRGVNAGPVGDGTLEHARRMGWVR